MPERFEVLQQQLEQAKRALQASEARFRNIIEKNPDGIVVMDEKGVVLFVNQAAEAILARPAEKLVGSSLGFPVTAGQRNEIDLIHPGGQTLVAEMCITESEWENQPALLASLRDITKRKQLENVLREGEDKFRSISENAVDYIFIKDQSRKYAFINRAMRGLLNVSPDQLPQKTLEEIFGPEQARIIQEIDDRTFSGETVNETRQLLINGETFFFNTIQTPLSVQDGEVVSIMGIVRDVTDFKKGEKALQESEEKYRLLAETTHDVILLHEMDGQIIYVNQAGLDLVGFEPAQFIGRSIADFVSAEEQAGLIARQEQRATGDHQTYQYETELINRTGERFPVEVNSTPVLRSGQVSEILVVARDITERIHHQKVLQSRMEQLTALNQASQVVTASLDIDQVLAEIVVLASELTTADYTSVITISEDDQPIQSVENIPDVPSIAHRIRENGFTNWIIRTRQAVVVDEIDGLGRISPNLGLDAPTYANPEIIKANVKSFVGLPLVVKDRPLGVLYLHSVHPFAFRNELPLLSTFANQAAIAIENARLYQETQQLAEFNRWIIQSMSEGIVVESVDGIFSFVNPAAAKMLGYEPDELVGLHWTTIIPPGQRPIVEAADQRRERGEADRYELALLCKDGKHIVVLVSGTPRFDAEDRFAGTMAVFTNISEQKRAEAALRESEKRYRTLFEHAQDAIFLENTKDEIIDANRQACELMGYSRSELLHMSVPDLQASEVRGKKGTVIKLELEKYGGRLFETMNLHADGRRIPVEVSTAAVPGQEKGLVLSIVRDITERKRAEKALRQYTHHLETLNKVTAALSTSLALDEVLKLILEQVQSVISVNSATIFLIEELSLRVVMDWGIVPSNLNRTFPVDDELFNIIEKSREPLILNEPLQDPRFQNWGGFEKAQTWMGVPLIARDELIGCMTLDSNQPHAFLSEQISLLKSFAGQAAQAIDNARQFSSARRRLERISSLHQIDQAITSNLDLRVTLNVLLEHVLNQLEVDAAAVLLYHPELQNLEYVAGQGFHTQVLQYTSLHLGEGFAGVAALERRLIRVPNLNQVETGHLNSPEFRHEKFIAYLGVPLLAKGNITGVLEIFHRQPLNPDSEWMTFLKTLAGQAAIAIDNIKMFSDLQRTNLELVQAYDATIEGWSKALELRDMETEGHSRRVVDLTLDLARALGMQPDQLAHVRRGALLHDIGKMGIPDAILQKPTAFTAEEWEIMRQHPLYAYRMLAPISYLKPALDIPYCHHEKWDGSGYPRGLKGEQIPLAARIFAVVDVWDALLSDRPYRSAWPHKRVTAYIRNQSGMHFDPQVVEAFEELLSKRKNLEDLIS